LFHNRAYLIYSIFREISKKYLKIKESMGYELFAFLTMSGDKTGGGEFPHILYNE